MQEINKRPGLINIKLLSRSIIATHIWLLLLVCLNVQAAVVHSVVPACSMQLSSLPHLLIDSCLNIYIR